MQIPDAAGDKLLFDSDTLVSKIKEAEFIGISVHVHPWVQTDIERAARTLVLTSDRWRRAFLRNVASLLSKWQLKPGTVVKPWTHS